MVAFPVAAVHALRTGPAAASQHASHASQVLARSMLGLGTSVHWLMQVCAMLTPAGQLCCWWLSLSR